MLIPDYETEVDFLNCEAISSTVVSLLKDNRNRALTVGIHGDWGAGKSSILKMIESELGKDKQVAVLWFNGWAFEGFDDAKAVLIESTIAEICRLKKGSDKLKCLSKRLLKRVDFLKIAKHAGGVAINTLAGMPLANQVTAIGALEDAQNIPNTIHAFHEDFRALLDEANIEQLVVLIDDLDRCLPTTAIETLEAIRLFLFVPKTAFVIGADEAMIEYAVQQHFPNLPAASGSLPYARNYLEKLVQIPFRIPALGAQETRTYVTLLLVQTLVDENHAGFKELLRKAKETMQKPWLNTGLSQSDIHAVDKDKREALDAAFILAQQIAPILADGTRGNPRQIKRFLNTLLVRQSIAKARGFSKNLINQRILAKLMLAERFQLDFYDYIASQAMVSSEGLAHGISALEERMKAPSPKVESEKVTKKKKLVAKNESDESELTKWLESDWLKRWFDIEPTMTGIDLRPYVFVAHDNRVLLGVSEASVLDGLVEELKGSKLKIRAAENRIKALSSSDSKVVFNRLRECILGVGNFGKQPRGIEGLSIVAKHHPNLQSEVISLLGSIGHEKLGIWVIGGWNESITDVAAVNGLKILMQKWADQSDNEMLKRGASQALATFQNGIS